MKTIASSVGYMPHLDGVRAVAVSFVISEHWKSGLPPVLRDAIAALDLSLWGVECFFVLSGFLITLILLKDKKESQSVSTALGHFYTRRILRIFPAYYMTLFLVFLLVPDSTTVVSIHALYFTNLYSSWTNDWLTPGGHFWSLALEEQFYLFWPLLVLTVSTKNIRTIALILCVVAPIWRFALLMLLPEHNLARFMSPPAALDLLCFGALLAWVRHTVSDAKFIELSRNLWIVGIAAFMVYLWFILTARDTIFFQVFGRTLSALVFGALVVKAANGFSGTLAAILGNPVAIWVGMVSYGLYIFHPFVPKIYLGLGRLLGVSGDLWGTYYIRYPAMLLTLLTVTSLSYYMIERPIRGWRKRFL